MSAPIHSLLADELDLPDDQAEKLLGAMLREVRKRARSRGVRLPELGKFREKNGELTFEPSDSLARAVNHRFEGLDSEDLGSAPEQAGEDEEESDEGPSTITLGYQDSSNWSPIDAEDESAESEGEDDEADTAEFEVPSAEEAAAPDEMQASGDTPQQESQQSGSPQHRKASEPSDSTADPAASQTDTEELYPLVEDVPGDSDEADARSEPESPADPSEEDEEYDRERDTLSDIWGSNDADPEPTEAPETPAEDPDADSGPSTFDEMDPFDDSEETTTEDPPSTEYLDQEPISEPEPASTAADPSATSEPEPAPPEAPPSEESTTDEPTPESSTKEKSTTLRVFVSLLILILVGGATWYILGQRGITPRPRTTFAQLKAQVQPHVQDLPVIGTTDESGSPGTSSSATGSASDPQPSGSTSGSEPTESTSSSEASATPSATAATTTGGSSQQIDPAAGGWTIVVASRTQQAPAQTLVNDFRQRFPDQQLPIDVVPGNVENTTRYRVGVGQFDSREAAQQFLDEFGSDLPDGAWPLRLQ